jgi:hypothetical protein
MAFSGAVKTAEEIQRVGGVVSGFFVAYTLSDDSTTETRAFVYTFTGAELATIIAAGSTMAARRAKARQLVIPYAKAAYQEWMADIASRVVSTPTDPAVLAADPALTPAELS